tara:strand:+ start:215 stop:382 length:168 start_codon:yes stop_codon:yes gene_type:complete
MKITIRHKGTEIIVSENENDTKDRVASMRWSDQNKQIQETIVVMADQIKKLLETS